MYSTFYHRQIDTYTDTYIHIHKNTRNRLSVKLHLRMLESALTWMNMYVCMYACMHCIYTWKWYPY